MVTRRNQGFTIVELLIVIVVIAILATISVVAYTGIQVRARDTMRTDSIAKIKKALELYKADNGQYPEETLNPGNSTTEVSTDVPGSFMEYLSNYGFPNGGPIDPINSGNHIYWYVRYPAGSGGCPASRGGLYILWAAYENNSSRPLGSSSSTIASCTSPGPDWADTGGTWYTYLSFEK